MRLAQRGDREALGFLYSCYCDDVYAYVRSIVRDHHEAEDLTQHVFAKLIGVIGRYREREVPFLAWMLRVARNTAIDHIRRQRAVASADVRRAGVDALDASAPVCVSDIKDALATLPPAQREVLVLRHLAGLTPGEIALRTGRSQGAIHGLHHRGRRALWTELVSRDMAPVTWPRAWPR